MIVMLVALGLVPDASAQCLQAEQDEYVEGMLGEHFFTDAAGRPEPAYILRLSAPACLNGEDETDNVENARTIQIYGLDASVDDSISRLVGHSVRVSGEPFGAMTVHHHAPILMEVSQIWPIQTRSSSSQQTFQPPRGSELRAELLDAARLTFEEETGGPIEFVVKRLNVLGDWAFGEVRLKRPGGVPIDWMRTIYSEDYAAGMFDPSGSFFLLHGAGPYWDVAEYATGPTDVPLALFQE